jgi:hypothetical protein
MRQKMRFAAFIAAAAVACMAMFSGVKAAAGTQAAAGARALVSSPTWGTAEEAPGTTALAKGGITISAVSCASAGSCSAGGSYLLGND